MTSLAFPYRRWPRWRASVSKHLSFFFLFILYFLPKHRLLQLTTTLCKLIVLEICNFIISLVSLQLSFFFFVSNNLCYHYCMFLYHNDRTIISGLCIKIYWCFFFIKEILILSTIGNFVKNANGLLLKTTGWMAVVLLKFHDINFGVYNTCTCFMCSFKEKNFLQSYCCKWFFQLQ